MIVIIKSWKTFHQQITVVEQLKRNLLCFFLMWLCALSKCFLFHHFETVKILQKRAEF